MFKKLRERVRFKKEHKSDEGGLTQAGRDYYNNKTGANLQAPVTKEAASKSEAKAKRRKSFCARMSKNPGPLKDKNGKPTRKSLALKRWDC